jgi:alpha/beta superfamily hydrolase
VFDLYGERDLAAVVGSAAERAWVVASIEGSRQLRIASADHFFAGREAELVEAIATYLLR